MSEPHADAGGATAAEADGTLEVWIDQDLCTGDGLCVQYAPEVFEFDIDGLAYVKNAAGDLLTDEGAATPVATRLRLDVVDASRDCPGNCIHVRRAADGVEVAGPDADAAQAAEVAVAAGAAGAAQVAAGSLRSP